MSYELAAKELGISVSTVRRAMKVLVKEGKVMRVGADKNGSWVVVPQRGPGE